MSQNRHAERGRIEAHNEYLISVKAEREILALLEHLDAQDHALAGIHKILRDGVAETP
jgi:uncharacterized membrane protein